MGWCCCLFLVILIACVILSLPKPGYLEGESIGCYTCESRSGSDRRCDDGSYTAAYQESCVPREAVAMSQGYGILPHYCAKIVGLDMTTNTDVTIRTCSQRYRNECKSPILFNGRAIDGCIYTCSGKYCNGSTNVRIDKLFLFLSTAISLILLLRRFR